MRIPTLIATLILLTGCITVRTMAPTEQTVVRTRYHRAPIIVFLNEPSRPYRSIGKVSVWRYTALWTTKNPLKLCSQLGIAGSELDGDAVIVRHSTKSQDGRVISIEGDVIRWKAMPNKH